MVLVTSELAKKLRTLRLASAGSTSLRGLLIKGKDAKPVAETSQIGMSIEGCAL